ncbi:MAG: Rpn family recombination-promoting nuclease/putative transposase [Synergistaceae bacterium]|jgi:predicted transposase/invertase (TIGR01784 family)|nr:Rpn family recombination-promoting nuclease/putative transposase [Synergistaceae bacterium]
MAKSGRKPKGVPADETLDGTPQISNSGQIGRDATPRLLPLKNDLVFKLIFGDYRYIAAIRAFLIAAFDIPAEEYEGLEIIDPHLERDSPDDKLSILDVRVQLKNKKLISVEVQIRKTPFMAERVAFSTGRGLARQIGPGQDYAAIERVVTIVIADYDMIPGGKSYRHVFRLYDKDNGVLLTDVMEIHTLELGKLPETAARTEEGELLDWLRLIRSESEEEIEMLATKTEEMKMTVGRLKTISADERTRMLYEARPLYLMDEAARCNAAVAEGRAEGEGKRFLRSRVHCSPAECLLATLPT